MDFLILGVGGLKEWRAIVGLFWVGGGRMVAGVAIKQLFWVGGLRSRGSQSFGAGSVERVIPVE